LVDRLGGEIAEFRREFEMYHRRVLKALLTPDPRGCSDGGE
jgi:hypothetical protein